MSATPFAIRLPSDSWEASSGASVFKWWPWPVTFPSHDFSVNYPSAGAFPPREVLDWLSVAEWKFEVSLDNFYGSTPRTVSQTVKPGSRYVHKFDMGAAEVQGRPSSDLRGNMAIGFNGYTGLLYPYMCGIEMSWREIISTVRYTYGFEIYLPFPGPTQDGFGDTYWSIAPVCQFSMEIADEFGGSPVTTQYDYVNFLGEDFVTLPDEWITLSRVTIDSTL